MYFYYLAGDSKFHVGFYTRDGNMIVESKHNKHSTAAARVSYLNGGGCHDDPHTVVDVAGPPRQHSVTYD